MATAVVVAPPAPQTQVVVAAPAPGEFAPCCGAGAKSQEAWRYAIAMLVLNIVVFIFTDVVLAQISSAECYSGNDCNAVVGLTITAWIAGVLNWPTLIVNGIWLGSKDCCHKKVCCQNGTQAILIMSALSAFFYFISMCVGGGGVPYYDNAVTSAWALILLCWLMTTAATVLAFLLMKADDRDQAAQQPAVAMVGVAVPVAAAVPAVPVAAADPAAQSGAAYNPTADAPPPSSSANSSSALAKSLAEAKLDKYEAALQGLGVSTVADLSEVEESDLMELGMTKFEMRRFMKNYGKGA